VDFEEELEDVSMPNDRTGCVRLADLRVGLIISRNGRHDQLVTARRA
jgi:hypothetical protein